MLLEIFFGLPIEDVRKPEDLGPNNQPNEMSDFQAVLRWLREREDAGEVSSFAFHSATGYCLKCFVGPSASLKNEYFSKTVEAQILPPLEEEMTSLLYGRRGDA
ncbi:uncharacterized protein BDZ99DRAFT_464025 [Mytilinidion resinicola]|uniref:Uncharacterized protein n=1 Tax=Mytilinidion resinicola TaxID=574789 RepID=A0A6A6YL42_9PEZI|nr:uncharacterized protein BDZ99DRAFT_464025 [Mytilinidion resinicola]KAF2809248.1 hypothetical protein BDZ99DRAFT_464025 [Mytilinidion resinicola]